MKLTNIHREALLDELEESKKELTLNQRLLNEGLAKQKKNSDERPANEYREIVVFLIEARIELIKQSIISNEIEY